MLLLTVLAGVIVWAVLDQVQTRRLKQLFEADLTQKLQKSNQEHRVRFDNYVAGYSQAVKLIVSQHSFHEAIAALPRRGPPAKIMFHADLPPWLPDAAVMRKFSYINYALLIDANGRTREVYQGQPGPPPASLLQSSGLTQQLSHNQSYMTELEGAPFLLASETLPGSAGAPTATLMLAARLDDEFLASSQRSAAMEGEVVALIGGREPRIVASSRPELVPAGARPSELNSEYLITGKSFFDSGASDLRLQLTTLMAKREFEKLNKDIMAAERAQRAMVGIALIAAFALIMLRITRHLRLLTNEISDVSQNHLNIELPHDDKGDELRVLGNQFRNFTREIVESRDRLKRLADEERERLQRDKAVALSEVKALSGLLPICSSCKKIRDDNGYWNQVESYISKHSDAVFSHGICPDCMVRLYPEYAKGNRKKQDGGGQ
jgi:hypothetical protein